MIVVQSAWPSGPFKDYEVTWKDFEPPMQQVYIDASVFNDKNGEILKEQLTNLAPEFRAFVLASAKMICEAGE